MASTMFLYALMFIFTFIPFLYSYYIMPYIYANVYSLF